MNLKNFIIGGLVGGIVDYLLGWLLWGILFKDYFPEGNEDQMNMTFIFLGCMTFGFFVSYVFTRWANISTLMTGLSAGAIFGLFLGLYSNFFRNSMEIHPNHQMMIVDLILTVICGAVVGGVIGLVNGKMK